MQKVPKTLDNAKVILYSPVDQRHKLTGRTRHTIDGVVFAGAKYLAVCTYGKNDFYLFYCDENWEVQTDTLHYSLADAIEQAEYEYEGVSQTFQKLDDE